MLTRPQIIGDGSSYTVTNFVTQKYKRHTPSSGGGHGGGDAGLSEAFVRAVAEKDQTVLGTDGTPAFHLGKAAN